MSIQVVFFGGFLASQPNVDLWKASAENLCPGVKYDAFPFPAHTASDDVSAVKGFEDKFDGVINNIQSFAADQLFIVGHSSGCAIANSLNSRLKGDHSKITLVDLDGFAPRADQIKDSTVQAWSAEGAGGKGRSLRWAAGHRIYPAPLATQTWSLHFSLVNSAATDAITQDNYKDTGYAGCVANLYWLP